MALNITHQIGGSLRGGPLLIPRGPSSMQSRLSSHLNFTSIWKPLLPEFIFRRIKEPTNKIQPPADIESVRLSSVVNNEQLDHTVENPTPVKKEEVEEEKVRGVPVYVMLPLDTVKKKGGLKRKKVIDASMSALRCAGVEGVMMDVWWGLVEWEAPGEYDWSAYVELMNMARKHKLKVQAVMSFHHCGANVGDSCTISLPRWVVEIMGHTGDLSYTDRYGRRSQEYISLGCDTVPVLRGRTPVQCYRDFMVAFRNRFSCLLGSTIVEIQVGVGPAGELRYPSYPEKDTTWQFPGIGGFQCYDKYMLRSLNEAAAAEGKPEWGHGGPTDAGGYNNRPEDTCFFCRHGGWSTSYGDFFLTWYSQQLIDHGERIISSAKTIFFSNDVTISVKVAGIHWHYGTRSHAAELTAGYYNTRVRDGYLPIAQMLRRHGAAFNFTCLEMNDLEHPRDAKCMPEALVRQVVKAAREAEVELSGENALPRYDRTAYEQILKLALTAEVGRRKMMHGFTYLRMCSDLFHPRNWKEFVVFVKKMADGNGGGRDECALSLTRVPAGVSMMNGKFEMEE